MKTIQYTNQHNNNTELNLKSRFVWEKKGYKNEWNVIYFDAVFFEVQAWIFMQLIILQTLSSMFFSYFFKTWWKN